MFSRQEAKRILGKEFCRAAWHREAKRKVGTTQERSRKLECRPGEVAWGQAGPSWAAIDECKQDRLVYKWSSLVYGAGWRELAPIGGIIA